MEEPHQASGVNTQLILAHEQTDGSETPHCCPNVHGNDSDRIIDAHSVVAVIGAVSCEQLACKLDVLQPLFDT